MATIMTLLMAVVMGRPASGQESGLSYDPESKKMSVAFEFETPATPSETIPTYSYRIDESTNAEQVCQVWGDPSRMPAENCIEGQGILEMERLGVSPERAYDSLMEVMEQGASTAREARAERAALPDTNAKAIELILESIDEILERIDALEPSGKPDVIYPVIRPGTPYGGGDFGIDAP